MQYIHERALEREKQEFEQKMKKIRHKNRLNVDELIQPLLNLDIVTTFEDQEKNDFPTLPIQFENSTQYF